MPDDHQYPSWSAHISRVVGGELARSTAADAARTLVDAAATGSLSTINVDPAGYPFGSVVSYALDADGDPLFVISELAEHTRNVIVDGRASLLATEPSDGVDPLARGRVTLIGDVAVVADADQRDAVDLVAGRHPGVAGYASYGDFAYYRLRALAIRWVGGFGEMDWVGVDEYRRAVVDPVLPRRHGIIAHMNEDHAAAGATMCARALGAPVEAATMRHVDRFGCEYVARSGDELVVVRLAFPELAASADDVRRLTVALVREAERP